MARSDEPRLDDMRERGANVVTIVARGRATFDNDEVLRLALERALEIVGDTATNVSAETRSRFPTVPWDDITQLCTRMAHHCHRTNPDRLWVIATEHVPPLAEARAPIDDDRDR